MNFRKKLKLKKNKFKKVGFNYKLCHCNVCLNFLDTKLIFKNDWYLTLYQYLICANITGRPI